MANQNCNGDFFYLENDKNLFYCCMWDSSVMCGVKQGEECPNCKRKITAVEHKEKLKVKKETIYFVTIPNRGETIITSLRN